MLSVALGCNYAGQHCNMCHDVLALQHVLHWSAGHCRAAAAATGGELTAVIPTLSQLRVSGFQELRIDWVTMMLQSLVAGCCLQG